MYFLSDTDCLNNVCKLSRMLLATVTAITDAVNLVNYYCLAFYVGNLSSMRVTHLKELQLNLHTLDFVIMFIFPGN